MKSTDVNKDGLQDLFICGPAGQSSSLFIQNTKGGFNPSNVALFESDMASQDENACFFDADMDGDLDLYVVSGAYLTTLPDQLWTGYI
ncbi:MAG: VCBS repeat-containing protein [Saprospiraceae bacterium]|nr:VCBS repeat-containing protein [Saprospiraceae bacterium]